MIKNVDFPMIHYFRIPPDCGVSQHILLIHNKYVMYVVIHFTLYVYFLTLINKLIVFTQHVNSILTIAIGLDISPDTSIPGVREDVTVKPGRKRPAPEASQDSGYVKPVSLRCLPNSPGETLCPAELFPFYFSSFEAGIANAISSFKWLKKIQFWPYF